MTEKLREQAELRYEQEQQEQRRRAEADKERGIRDHIEAIQKQRDQERREQARKEAEAEAEEFSARRHDLAGELEEAAASVNRKLAEYEALDRRHRDALRRAGRNPGHDNSLAVLLPRWFAHRFGGFGRVTGVPGGHPSGKDRPLPERDPMASPGQRGRLRDRPDGQEG